MDQLKFYSCLPFPALVLTTVKRRQFWALDRVSFGEASLACPPPPPPILAISDMHIVMYIIILYR